MRCRCPTCGCEHLRQSFNIAPPAQAIENGDAIPREQTPPTTPETVYWPITNNMGAGVSTFVMHTFTGGG